MIELSTEVSESISSHGVALKTFYKSSTDSLSLDEYLQQMQMDDSPQTQCDRIIIPAPAPSFKVYVMAGAAAGIMEHCIMYPVDCVKTRMQSLRPEPKAVYKGVFDAFKKIIMNEGLFTPLRGMNIVAAGAGPAHALYFGSYETAKKTLGKVFPNKQGHSPFTIAPAGVLATIFHDGAMNPIEVIKQRMQMYGSPYRGVVDCARTIVKEEGIKAFYRSYTTQLTMNIPFQAIHFMTYEFMKETISDKSNNTYNFRTHLISGATAGGIAAATTTPLDVAKTLLNTQERAARPQHAAHNQNQTFIRGIYGGLKTIYRLQGVRGYFKGLTARVIYQTPSCAICWSVYEFFKYFLTLSPEEERQWMENAI